MVLPNDREGSTGYYLELPNRLVELESLHGFFERVGRESGWSDRLRANMTLACEELLTNTISYGYPEEGDHRLQVTVFCSERQVEVVLEDDGVPFDPLTAEEPDLGLSLEERAIGGLGIHFVRTLMDEMAYERTSSGNRLVLLKKV